MRQCINEGKRIGQSQEPKLGQRPMNSSGDSCSSLFEYPLFNKTIEADVTSNRTFLSTHFRITIALIIMAVLLKLLPSPMAVSVVENDPAALTRLCDEEVCSHVEEGFETVVIKKINPLHRELRYFVRLNWKAKEDSQVLFDWQEMDVFKQITWVEIYAARDNQIYGDVLFQRGGDFQEGVFRNQRLVSIGQVYLLNEVSYLLRIYKKVRVFNTSVSTRLLQDISLDVSNDSRSNQNLQISSNDTVFDQINTNSTAINNSNVQIALQAIDNSSLQELSQQSLPNNTISAEQLNDVSVRNETTDVTNGSILIQQSKELDRNDSFNQQVNDTNTNTSIDSVHNASALQQPTNISGIPSNSSNQTQQTIVTNYASVPLTVQIVRYSQFFTGTELLIRYITFLYILYVRADTIGSPTIFHLILLFTANPLIFTEIAFPNIGSSILSTMCSSAYIFYVGIFLSYTHASMQTKQLDVCIIMVKTLGLFALYGVNLFRQLHLINEQYSEFILSVLVMLIMIPLLQYLRSVYFLHEKTVLHRSVLFIFLTIYYSILLMFNNHVVEYGWRRITSYLIVLAFGVSICYLTRPYSNAGKTKMKRHRNSLDNIPISEASERDNNFTEQNLDNRHFPSQQQKLQILARIF